MTAPASSPGRCGDNEDLLSLHAQLEGEERPKNQCSGVESVRSLLGRTLTLSQFKLGHDLSNEFLQLVPPVLREG